MTTPIYLIVGSPAVGKSTTARTLAAQFAQSLHIPVDDLRNMVVSGLLQPGAEWSRELMAQITLARKSAATIALNYHDAGYAVVIDDFLDSNYQTDYELLLSHPALHKLILYPTQEEAHRRNFVRAGDSPARGYIDEGIRIVYAQLAENMPKLIQDGWSIIDSTTMSVEAVVENILQHSRR